ncbi:SMEK domain-containing protein [Pseudoxanthomonas sp.]|uniref:SMEK domain-containing protein n=1 Tax=Pseudoxanthomonas sp. TaxID=1871049 RepID=UPI0035AE7E3D
MAMITRGFYIGEVIDELSALAAQVSLRNKLGLTDLSTLTENFFRDLLNAIHKSSLVSLNEERSNSPGLDLGDDVSGLAIQVTATASAAKVDKTLAKITPDHQARYKRFVVLVVGKKQGSYSIDEQLSERLGFRKDRDIWDVEDLARQVVALDIVRLELVHRLIRKEVARIKVELEIPDVDGKYPTSGYDLWEQRVQPKVGDGNAFRTFVAQEASVSNEEIDEDLSKEIQVLAKRLSRLPRVTREFLVMLLTRQSRRNSGRFHPPWMTLLYDVVKREFRGDDLEGELGILKEEGFVEVRDEIPYDYGPAEIGVRFPSKCEELSHSLLPFIAKKGLSLRAVIGEVDFSAL